jgi:oligoribonuclease
MASGKDRLVWFDMEMTGLDPVECVPLQAAIVITSGDLTELDAVEVTIWQPESALANMEPVVQRMHESNGLLKAVRASDLSLVRAERQIFEVLARWCGVGEGVLAGNSIHQDRRFIARYFPMLDRYLHYRMVDVSTIKELITRWYSGESFHSKGASQHTALADARASVEELKAYRNKIFRATPG